MADPDLGGIRLALMGVTDAVEPFHDWLAGEVTYLEGQGYTPREARAMAAVTYVTMFGSRIHADDDDQEGPST